MRVSIVPAGILIGFTLLSGCTRTPPPPMTAQIVVEKIDANEEWRPSNVAIMKGGTVTWNNTSSVLNHSVVSGEGLFPTKTLGGGESFNYTFTQNGTFTYHDAADGVGIADYFVGTIYVK